MRLLVSVRSVDEALIAARGGAGFIDLKEPRNGALGALPPDLQRAICAALKAEGWTLPISATVGDLPLSDLRAVLAQVVAVAASGVDYVKVGIEAGPQAESALLMLETALATTPTTTQATVVPVLIADHGIDEGLVRLACQLHFPALMLDTADKHSGSLFERVSAEALHRFVQTVQAAGLLAGLAGALRRPQLPLLLQLAPDFAGFRSAVCVGDRGGELSPKLLQELSLALREGARIDRGVVSSVRNSIGPTVSPSG